MSGFIRPTFEVTRGKEQLPSGTWRQLPPIKLMVLAIIDDTDALVQVLGCNASPAPMNREYLANLLKEQGAML